MWHVGYSPIWGLSSHSHDKVIYPKYYKYCLYALAAKIKLWPEKVHLKKYSANITIEILILFYALMKIWKNIIFWIIQQRCRNFQKFLVCTTFLFECLYNMRYLTLSPDRKCHEVTSGLYLNLGHLGRGEKMGKHVLKLSSNKITTFG